MKGGTYAEALKVGFDAEQAGFLARLGIDARHEAVEQVFDHLERNPKRYLGMKSEDCLAFCCLVIGFAAGVGAGVSLVLFGQ